MSEHLEHMDIGSRNGRLYATLRDMGLFVLPVFAKDDPERIDYMQVSVTLPAQLHEAAQQATSGAVAAPMTSSDISKGVESTKSGRDGVINFPSVLRQLAVVRPADVSTVAVDTNVGLRGNFTRI